MKLSLGLQAFGWLIAVAVSGLAGEKPAYRTPILPAPELLPGVALRSHNSKAVRGTNLPAPLTRSEASEFPYTMVGSLDFRSGRGRFNGSATLVKPTVALTAGHNLYDGESGFSSNVRFARGLYAGSAQRRATAKAIYLTAETYVNEADRDPNTNRAFSFDTGWITFRGRLAGAQSARYTSRYAYLTSGRPTVAVGYGLDFHNGREPLVVEPTAGFFRKRGAYFENATYGTEGGMSGGPLFGTYRGKLVQIGVVVSGFDDYTQSGIRAIDRRLLRQLRAAR